MRRKRFQPARRGYPKKSAETIVSKWVRVGTVRLRRMVGNLVHDLPNEHQRMEQGDERSEQPPFVPASRRKNATHNGSCLSRKESRSGSGAKRLHPYVE